MLDDRDFKVALAIYGVVGLLVCGFWGFVLYLAWRLVEWATG